MTRSMAKTMQKDERGMALLLTLFALLLLSAIGLFLVLSSNTETRIDANYGSSLRAYYAARSGLEEVRDRVKYPSNSPVVPGLADLLPQDVTGNANGVLYVLNPVNGETIDPTDSTSPYFDDELCHAYNSGTPKGIKCTSVPTTQGWQLPSVLSQLASPTSTAGQVGFKWVRINMKTNRTADPYFVDQLGGASTLDTRICWDGQTEQLSPNGSCDANGMQTVYMLTALATTNGATGPNGARKVLQFEVAAPSIRPAGVLTASLVAAPSSSGIPSLAVDGRVHKLDGSLAINSDGVTLATVKGCSSVAPLATDNGTSALQQALNQLRLNIVNTANSACNSSGTSGGCTPGLAWVRGTASTPRFFTSTSTSGSNTSGSSSGGSSTSSTTGSSSGSTSGSTSGGHDGGSKSSGGSGSVSYTNLDLSSPQLYGLSPTATAQFAPFIGHAGNQSDATVYQPGAVQTVADEIAAVTNMVKASQGQPNYFTASSATLGLNSSFGSASPTNPAIVVDAATDTTTVFTIPNGATLTGSGILVITNALEIYGTLKWTGIVLVNSSAGHVTVGSNAAGFINGALLLAPGATFNFPGSSAPNPNFIISYSCEAIDLPFNTLPFKIVSTAETSF